MLSQGNVRYPAWLGSWSWYCMSDFDVRFVLWLIFRACMFNKGKMVRSQSACDINEVDCSTNTRAFGGGTWGIFRIMLTLGRTVRGRSLEVWRESGLSVGAMSFSTCTASNAASWWSLVKREKDISLHSFGPLPLKNNTHTLKNNSTDLFSRNLTSYLVLKSSFQFSLFYLTLWEARTS